MDAIIAFDTPENITIEYRLAGPGTRFTAYWVDMLIQVIAAVVLTILFFLTVLGASYFEVTLPDFGEAAAAIVVSLAIVLIGFMGIGYFALFEWLMNGQTPGKRLLKIRVVRDKGFRLGLSAILLRNIARVVDTAPPLWPVPLASKKFQRLGDLMAGTIVVREDISRLQQLRAKVVARSPHSCAFSFTPAQLAQTRPRDVRAAELFLDRRGEMMTDRRRSLALRLSSALSSRMQTPAPALEESEQYLEDFLTFAARRDAHELL